jgi:hypothetical protein
VHRAPQHSDDRVPDAHFPAAELLYRRYSNTHVNGRQLRPQAIRPLPHASVNREKYSVPEDVLHPNCCDEKTYQNLGVFAFSVESVEAEALQLTNDARVFQFFLVHDPLKLCKAHSEIQCRELTTGDTLEDVPKTIRERLRVRISQRLNIVLKATD